MDDRITRFVARRVGAHRVRTQLVRPASGAALRHVVDADGREWIAKSHSGPRPWLRELTAYRDWTPALGRHAARLHAAQPRTRTLILSHAGRPTVGRHVDDPALHHAAGTVLRRLHAATESGPAPDAGEALVAGSRRALDEQRHAFDRRERTVLAAMLDDVAQLATVSTVGCHLDYTPRNWLRDDDGTVRVVDFAASRRQPWLRDLLKLHCNIWPKRPGTREAFLDGYGMRLSEDHETLLDRMVATWVINSLVRVDASNTSKTLLRRRARERLSDLVTATC